VHLGNDGRDYRLIPWFRALSARLARVRVCSGDWSRVCGPSVTFNHGLTAVFLDPPYGAEANRHPSIYRKDSSSVAHDARQWAIEMGARPDMRIALCGYDGEHQMPPDWAIHAYKAPAGMASIGNGPGKVNRERERIWFSPACLPFNRQYELTFF